MDFIHTLIQIDTKFNQYPKHSRITTAQFTWSCNTASLQGLFASIPQKN